MARKLQKVCLLTNFNQYGLKRHFTEKLAEALRRQGIDTRIVDAEEKALTQAMIQKIRTFAPDFTCSFNSFNPILEGTFLWDFLEIPHASFLVDPSFYSTTLTNSPYSVITCVDRSDCTAIRSSGFERVLFWPHAVERELTYDPKGERDYDVVFLGSCCDYETFRAHWRKEFAAPVGKMLDEAVEIFFSDDRLSIAEALVTAWNAAQIDPSSVDFTLLYYYLDSYTRGKDRVELIRAIKDVPVHVFGEIKSDNTIARLGWDHYLGKQKNVTLHPPVPFDKSLEILKRSKIALNSMPFFRDGTHERVFAGLACGALVLTSASAYLREQFREGEGVVFYSSAQRGEAGKIIHQWLEDEERRREAVEKGCAIVKQRHTWDQRAEALLQALQPIVEQTGVKKKNTLIAKKGLGKGL